MDLHEASSIDRSALLRPKAATILLCGRHMLYLALTSTLPRMNAIADPLDDF